MWTVLSLPPKGIYHYSPLEAREVGKLCRKHGTTIIVTTPTFIRSYLRRCEPEEFAKLDVVFTGAEKLPVEIADAFEKRFGVRPSEGYGTTELSPIVAANIPHEPRGQERACRREARHCRTADSRGHRQSGRPRHGRRFPPGKAGMLWIKGPNVMKGYWKRPDLTAEVIRDGWNITGDVAIIDDEGFIQITGRISRFSKIAGEMVPHIRVEEAISELLKLDADVISVAVAAVPNAQKGERLVVLYTELGQNPEEICRKLAADGMPALWIPAADSFRHVDAIPVLGTGKLDLKRLQELALEVMRSAPTP